MARHLSTTPHTGVQLPRTTPRHRIEEAATHTFFDAEDARLWAQEEQARRLGGRA